MTQIIQIILLLIEGKAYSPDSQVLILIF